MGWNKIESLLGHPCKKYTYLIPGPSNVEKNLPVYISKQYPVMISSIYPYFSIFILKYLYLKNIHLNIDYRLTELKKFISTNIRFMTERQLFYRPTSGNCLDYCQKEIDE